MATLTLSLDDAAYEELVRRAARAGVPIEALVAAIVEAEAQSEDAAEFSELVERQRARYARLFKRLAE